MKPLKAILAVAIAVFTLSATDSANAEKIDNVRVQEISWSGAHYVLLQFDTYVQCTPWVSMSIGGSGVRKVGSAGTSHTFVFSMPAPTLYGVDYMFNIIGVTNKSIGTFIEHNTDWYLWGGGFYGGL
jgi:hypothetical protein